MALFGFNESLFARPVSIKANLPFDSSKTVLEGDGPVPETSLPFTNEEKAVPWPIKWILSYFCALWTTTLHVAVLPLFVLAVIVAVPTPTAVTTPLFTLAILESLLLHVIVLLVASLGVIVAFSVYLFPVFNSIFDLLIVIFWTLIAGSVTFIWHLLIWL